jgi:glycosyltransferase involved in cell wall biosynthesis
MTLPVYVCSIAKNEAKHVRRWAESAKDADAIYLLDTGSTDDTVKIARECGVIVFEKTYEDWSFAVARNDLRDMLPTNDAWLVNLDLDEVFCSGWREALDAVPLEFNRPRYPYDWNWVNPVMVNGEYDIEATRATSSVGLSYLGDKIVRRHSHRWVNRVHECNITADGYQELQVDCPGLRIQHFADNTKPRSNYLPLLLIDVEENPENDRNTYYAARELMYYGRTDESVKLFKRHITMASSWWAPERGFSMRYIARQVPSEREHWLLRAVAEYPNGRECWLDLAQHYYDNHRWTDCYWASKRCLELTNRGDLYLTEAHAWGWAPHDLHAIASYRIGLYEEALEHGKMAFSLSPNDKRLQENLFFYRNGLSKVTAVIPTKSNVKGLHTVVHQLLKESKVARIIVIGDGEEGRALGEALPSSVVKLFVPAESGINVMWNMGLEAALPKSHVLFINDDVEIERGTIDKLCAALDRNESYGLVCPKYWDGELSEDRYSRDTCRGRYDGTGGIAGFCFMLPHDIAHKYRFDENMKWWYSDDDVVWSVNAMERGNYIVAGTSIKHGHSVTIESTPPKAFEKLVEQDKQYFQKKWEGYIAF